MKTEVEMRRKEVWRKTDPEMKEGQMVIRQTDKHTHNDTVDIYTRRHIHTNYMNILGSADCVTIHEPKYTHTQT